MIELKVGGIYVFGTTAQVIMGKLVGEDDEWYKVEKPVAITAHTARVPSGAIQIAFTQLPLPVDPDLPLLISKKSIVYVSKPQPPIENSYIEATTGLTIGTVKELTDLQKKGS